MGQFGLLARSPVGIFVFSEQGDLLYFRLFSRNPQKAVEEFLKAGEAGRDISKELRKEVVEGETAYNILRKRLREYSKSLGFAENDADLNRFLSEFGYLLSKKRLAGAIGRDRLVVQSVNALDDLGKVTNLFQERLYEWFSLHYPEMKNTKDITDKIMAHGRRENFPGFRESTGADINERDEEMFREFASTIQNLLEEKDRLERYVSSAVREIAPNLSSLVDPVLAARLLAQAGSLEKMARMPSSTIQLLGAEKALFRHLNKKGRSPKYGIIFTTPVIQSASYENKGKVARILASKLMMAARIDYYSGRHDENIKRQLDEEIAKVRR